MAHSPRYENGLTAETAKSFRQRCIWITETYGVKITRMEEFIEHWGATPHRVRREWRHGWKVNDDGELVKVYTEASVVDGVKTVKDFSELYGNINDVSNKEIKHIIESWKNEEGSWQMYF